jgi:hypothetical protein
MTHAGAKRYFESYAKAFDEFNARDITEFFDVPCIITSPSGSGAFTSPDQLIQNFEAVNARHRSIGYSHAVLLALEIVRHIQSSFVEIDALWSFRREDGSEIYAFPMSYILRNVAGEWKISCSVNAEG